MMLTRLRAYLLRRRLRRTRYVRCVYILRKMRPVAAADFGAYSSGYAAGYKVCLERMNETIRQVVDEETEYHATQK